MTHTLFTFGLGCGDKRHLCWYGLKLARVTLERRTGCAPTFSHTLHLKTPPPYRFLSRPTTHSAPQLNVLSFHPAMKKAATLM